MSRALEPLGDRILVKQRTLPEESSGGIFIPDAARERPQEAEVIEVGDVEITLDPGDIIFYSKFGGTELTVDGEEYLVLREGDVLARVRDGAE